MQIGKQEDAHEFLVTLHGKLEEELIMRHGTGFR